MYRLWSFRLITAGGDGETLTAGSPAIKWSPHWGYSTEFHRYYYPMQLSSKLKRHDACFQQEPRQTPVRNSFKGSKGSSRTRASSCYSTPTIKVHASTRSLKEKSTQGHRRAAGCRLHNKIFSSKNKNFFQFLCSLETELDQSAHHWCNSLLLCHRHTHTHMLSSLSKQANRWGFHPLNGSCFQK